jgi:hypothetical protein
LDKALQIILQSMATFNTFAPAAGQIIARFRRPDGTEITIEEAIAEVRSKNDAGISRADEYLENNPPTE